MTRGKNSTSANGRRLGDALARIETLEEALATERKSGAARVRSLKAELQAVRGDFSAKVKDHANALILAARSQARADLDSERQRSRERSVEAVRFIEEHGKVMLSAEDHTKLADLLGLTMGEYYQAAGVATNHHMRRQSTKQARLVGQVRETHGLS